MERKIITIGYEVPGYSDCCHAYLSDQSLLDADIIIFEPEDFESYSGKRSYDDSESYALQEKTNYWRREILTALEYGKTVFVILRKFQIATIRTGQKEFKGAKTINYVTDYDNYKFLPFEVPQIVARRGKEIIFTGHPSFGTFWKEFKKYLTFESYLDGKIKMPVFVTKTGEKPIGGIFEIEKGNLVLIPPIVYDEDKFTKYDKDKKQTFWTKEAIKFGSRLVDLFFEIDKSLRGSSLKTPPPEWVGLPIYSLDEELKITSKIEVVSLEIEKFGITKNSLIEELNNARQLKDLLFETGKPLEQAVISALKILGYVAENYDDGELELDQVIVSPEGQRFIGECEGKDASAINIDKFRQLEENIQSDLQREEVGNPAIGILFGNGFRLAKPEERAEQFTAKCLNSAKRGTILIRTVDLYPIVKYLKQNNDVDYAAACRSAILAGVGSIVKFPVVPNKESG